MEMLTRNIQNLLAGQPKTPQTDASAYERAVKESVKYLSSPAALQSINANPYWPKWDSPWWHMSVLFEMGLADRIPQVIAERMLAEVKRTHLPYFFREDAPDNKAPDQDAPCPCSFGNIYQVLCAAGLDVDAQLPWARAWFLKYQMPDGGLSCDEDAYRSNPPASSVVGTISPLEAILHFTPRPFTAEEERFLDQGACCLIERKLMRGCAAEQNAEERLDEADWIKPCFPRLYFYDVLRGLSFVLSWAEKRRKALPAGALEGCVRFLCEKFPDGLVRVERHSFEGVGTRVRSSSGEWTRSPEASRFRLLDEISEIGRVSPWLTDQWTDAKERIQKLSQEGLLA